MKPRYQGIWTTSDGAGAVVWVETHITEAAVAYPITSSTPMGVGYQAAVSRGMKNLWGTPLQFFEPESEHSSASAAEGFAAAGGRVVNFTSGQGLILMKEVLYVIAGKRLPVVFHIGARVMTVHSLNVHAGHDDVMGVADVGWGIVFAKNVQEAADLALIARRTAEDALTPFMVVQDGFLTTHTLENVRLPEPELMKEFVGDPRERLMNLLDPKHALQIGTVQNQDSYMKGKIAQRAFYHPLKGILRENMRLYSELTSRDYDLLESHRLEDAEYAIVTMGTMAETAQAAVDWMREEKGWRVGVLNVRTFRPFPGPEIVEALKHLKAFVVVERMDDPPAQSNHLTREIKAAFADALTAAEMPQERYPQVERIPLIYSASAGLGGRDVRGGDFIASVEHMIQGEPRRYFVLGIHHELALSRKEDPDLRPAGAFSMRGHSVGGFGSVTTNKVIASVVADLLDLYVQAFPKYGAEKKGLPTTYYLTVAKEPIRIHSELRVVNFVVVNDFDAFFYTRPLAGLTPGGSLFIQSEHDSAEALWKALPWKVRDEIVEKDLTVYYLDTLAIARAVAPTPDLEQRMQGIVLLGVFLKVAPFIRERNLPEEEVWKAVEGVLRKYFGKRGEAVVQANLEAVRRGYREVQTIPTDLMVGSHVQEV